MGKDEKSFNEELQLLDKLKPIDPTEAIKMNAGSVILKSNIEMVKIYDKDKISETEEDVLGKGLVNEWTEKVLKPYIKSLYEFSKKYNFFPMTQEICGMQPNFKDYVMMEGMKKAMKGELKL